MLPPNSALASYALARDLFAWSGARVKGTIHIRWLISSSLPLSSPLWLIYPGTLTVQLFLDWEGGGLPTLKNSLLNAWNLHNGLYSTDKQLYNTVQDWF